MKPHHLQLHLFEPVRDQPVTSPKIRQRLQPLLIVLLDEAIRDARPVTKPAPLTEANDE